MIDLDCDRSIGLAKAAHRIGYRQGVKAGLAIGSFVCLVLLAITVICMHIFSGDSP